MEHIISLTLENKFGSLSRVAGLFSGRGFNIESLSVAPTLDPSVSMMTLVTIRAWPQPVIGIYSGRLVSDVGEIHPRR